MKKELILEIIKERWSPCAFSSAPVEEFKLKAMFEAAGYAPSCSNEQPWIFVYTTRQEGKIFDDYIGFLNESNRIWAKEAYALAVSMSRITFSKTGIFNRFALYDTGMAVSNLLLQALSMDVYVHQMGGFSIERVKEYFGLDESIEPVAVMAIGYMGEGYSLPPELLKRDEQRRLKQQVNEYTYKNTFLNPAFQ